MSEVVQKVQLIRHTLSPEEMAALGAKLCYSGVQGVLGLDDGIAGSIEEDGP